jgi:hypothetical protein
MKKTMNVKELAAQNMWLASATSIEKPKLARIHANWSMDKHRIHIIGAFKKCKCKEKELHSYVKKLLEEMDCKKEKMLHIIINKQYLLDALAGLDENEDGLISIYVDKDNLFTPVFLSGEVNKAFIMQAKKNE